MVEAMNAHVVSGYCESEVHRKSYYGSGRPAAASAASSSTSRASAAANLLLHSGIVRF